MNDLEGRGLIRSSRGESSPSQSGRFETRRERVLRRAGSGIRPRAGRRITQLIWLQLGRGRSQPVLNRTDRATPTSGLKQSARSFWRRWRERKLKTASAQSARLAHSSSLCSLEGNALTPNAQRDSVSGSPTPDLSSACSRRCSIRGLPWKRSPVLTFSISIILALRRPVALIASTRNLPSQMNHDTTN
jgi:hypothetical protein